VINVHPLLAGIASDGLALETDLLEDPIADVDFSVLVTACSINRLCGLLARAIDNGRLAVTDEQRVRAFEAAARAATGDLLRERLLVEAVSLLAARGIEARVLKGAAAAHLDAEDPSLRSFGDVDLLVRPDVYDSAVAALQENGFSRRFPEPRPGFDARFGKGVAMYRGIDEVDLHRTLSPGPFGLWIRLPDLWAPGDTFIVRGHVLATPDACTRFLHACYHAILGGTTPRIAALRDAALIAASPAFDPVRMASMASRWRGTVVVRRATDSVETVLGVHLAEVRAAIGSGPDPAHQRRALGAYEVDGRGRYSRQAVAALRSLPTWRDRLAYTTALLAPQRDYVAGRHRSRSARWRHALMSALRPHRRA
jgi:hypothetical protein